MAYENDLRSPELTLRHADASCGGTTFSSVDRYETPQGIQYRPDAPHCRDVLRNLPSHGYALLDATQRTLRFADALAIEGVELATEERASLEADVTARIPGLTLYAESSVLGEESKGRIYAEDIVSSRVETTTVGSSGRPFVMAVAVLTLRNLDRLYPQNGSLARDFDLAARLRGKSVEYPVIFFRTPSREPRYVGDGSSCASYPVARAARAAEAPPDLGAVERFRITGAFDTNADGAPELLEVNDRFAYLLEPDGRLWVVNYGLGC